MMFSKTPGYMIRQGLEPPTNLMSTARTMEPLVNEVGEILVCPLLL